MWHLRIADTDVNLNDDKSQFACTIQIEVLHIKENQKYCFEFTRIQGSCFYFNEQFNKLEAAHGHGDVR